MNARQRFKLAVLQELADRGFTLEEMRVHVKSAADYLEKQAAGFDPAGLTIGGLGKLLGLSKTVAGYGLGAAALGAVVAPPVLGGLAGAAAARMTGDDEPDVEDAQSQELINRYRQLAQQARINNKLRKQKHGERPSFSRI